MLAEKKFSFSPLRILNAIKPSPQVNKTAYDHLIYGMPNVFI